MARALRIERLEELQAYTLDEAYDASPEERGWCEDIADALGELIARRRVEQAHAANPSPALIAAAQAQWKREGKS